MAGSAGRADLIGAAAAADRPTVNFRLQSLQTRNRRTPSVTVWRTPLEMVWAVWQFGHFGFGPRFMFLTSVEEQGPGAYKCLRFRARGLVSVRLE